MSPLRGDFLRTSWVTSGLTRMGSPPRFHSPPPRAAVLVLSEEPWGSAIGQAGRVQPEGPRRPCPTGPDWRCPAQPGARARHLGPWPAWATPGDLWEEGAGVSGENPIQLLQRSCFKIAFTRLSSSWSRRQRVGEGIYVSKAYAYLIY